MTVAAPTRTALVAAVQAQLAGIQVTGHPRGEDTALRESIWVEKAESVFEWRSLGNASKNRTEELTFDVRVQVYREGSDQTDACEAALARCESLLASVEDAVEADFSVDDNVSFGRIAGWTIETRPMEAGWSCDGRARFESTNYP